MPVCLSFYASDSKTLTWLSRIRWPKPVKPPKWTISAIEHAGDDGFLAIYIESNILVHDGLPLQMLLWF